LVALRCPLGQSDADSLRDLMHPDTRNLIPPMTEPGDSETVVERFRGELNRLPSAG